DTDKEIGRLINKLDAFCDTISPGSAYPYNVAGAFGYGHDDLETYISKPFINAAKNATTPTRKVRVSNEEDFFKDIERSYPKLPSESVSFGNEWDILSASMNETTARVRRATEKLRSAEALAAMASLKDRNFLNGLTAARNLAWESFGVYWEHNWTADGPVSRKTRAEWQIKVQRQLTDYVDTLYNRSAYTLGAQIKRTTLPGFYVFNPLSWSRNDVADVLYNGAYPVKVIDRLTKREVASQLIVKDGKRLLRIRAENIPPVGYKVFEIANGIPAALPTAATVKGEYISNALYRLRLSASGAITEWYDSLANSRQLVKETAGKYLNDLGTTNINDGDALVVENAGPVSVTIKAVSRNPILHTVRVTVFANSPRIEIEDSIQANFGDVKTWAFSFDLDNQTTRHEELGAILTAKKETRGGHYAAQNARYDWQTFNHFADMSEPAYGVTVSNMDCSFFKLGKSTVDSLWEQSAQLNALAGGNVDKKVEDNGVLGILKQNGQEDFMYKFAITTHQSVFDPVRAMKFSLEHQNPLITGIITGTKNAAVNNVFSLLNISDPNVLLWSVKPSEDGINNGLVARCWNMGQFPCQPLLTLSKPIVRAWKTTHIETNETSLKTAKGSLQLNFRPNQINTYRFISSF
ncbi:MAG: glycoside hydrolase, partial [Ferruginibacter sp.]|nr:glycoside hydrolase [Ferruginibacter sp.]